MQISNVFAISGSAPIQSTVFVTFRLPGFRTLLTVAVVCWLATTVPGSSVTATVHSLLGCISLML